MGGEVIEGDLWRNNKYGNLYLVIGPVVDANDINPKILPQVCYRSFVNQKMYYRDYKEFAQEFTFVCKHREYSDE